MKIVLLVAAIVSSVIATLVAVTFCMGMGANASPAEIRMLKIWMAGFSLVGVGGIVAGILLMRAGQPGNAVWSAFAPTLFVIVVSIIAFARSGK